MAPHAGGAMDEDTAYIAAVGSVERWHRCNIWACHCRKMICATLRDAEGTEHHFLADHYSATQEMASNTFRKGYQWPFLASHMLNYQSSLVVLTSY